MNPMWINHDEKNNDVINDSHVANLAMRIEVSGSPWTLHQKLETPAIRASRCPNAPPKVNLHQNLETPETWFLRYPNAQPKTLQ